MNAATFDRPDLSRRQSGLPWAAFLFAALMHAALFSLFYFGIRWQTRPAAPVEAELWSEPPRPARPAAVQPPPPAPEPPRPVVREEPRPEPVPAKPDIAIKDEKKKSEPKKEDKPKAEPKAEPKKEPKAPPKIEDDPIRRELLKEEFKRDLARQAQRDETATRAAAEAAAIGQKAQAEWGDRVKAKVRNKIPYSVANAVPGNPEAHFEVTLLPGLEVGSVRLTRSSGHAAYDDAAERAIRAASPLPPPQSDRVTPPRVLKLVMRPKDE